MHAVLPVLAVRDSDSKDSRGTLPSDREPVGGYSGDTLPACRPVRPVEDAGSAYDLVDPDVVTPAEVEQEYWQMVYETFGNLLPPSVISTVETKVSGATTLLDQEE